MELHWGWSSGDWGKILHQRVMGMEEDPQGVVSAPYCWSSRSICTVLSDTGFQFWVALFVDKGLT